MDSRKNLIARAAVHLNEKKFVEFLNEINFLGFKISPQGILPENKLVNKVLALKLPTSNREVECFLGLINFFYCLFPNLFKKIEPLN